MPTQPGAESARLQRGHAPATQPCAIRSMQPEQQVGQRPLAQPAQRSPGQPGLHCRKHRARVDEWSSVAPQHDLAHMATLQATTSNAMLSQQMQLVMRG